MAQMFVNVSCANIYPDATFHSEVDSQAVLWEQLEKLDEENGFYRVRCADGYEGWISSHQVAFADAPDNMRLIYRPYGRIYKSPQKKATVIRDYVSGCLLPVRDEQSGWAQTVLPDGETGWVREAAFGYFSRSGLRRMLVELAQEYLGVPYLWAGKSAKGMDCSGYVQLMHKLCGINVRRDAWMQHQDARAVSDTWMNARAGDLLFFAEKENKISHVGIKLNKTEVIHVRGMVRINSMDPAAENADTQLIDEFVSAGTFMEK